MRAKEPEKRQLSTAISISERSESLRYQLECSEAIHTPCVGFDLKDLSTPCVEPVENSLQLRMHTTNACNNLRPSRSRPACVQATSSPAEKPRCLAGWLSCPLLHPASASVEMCGACSIWRCSCVCTSQRLVIGDLQNHRGDLGPNTIVSSSALVCVSRWCHAAQPRTA